jgi:hypothetical protein
MESTKSHLSYLLFVSLLFLIAGCVSYPKSLETNFQFAGKNKDELKKVIRHYSTHRTDSLKRKAAIFLIENMDMHESYSSKAWDNFQLELDSLFKAEKITNNLYKGVDNLYAKYSGTLQDISSIPDLQAINSKFLIYNIDQAFIAWKTPYARFLNFADFCEYILPYRVGNEPLCNWREVFDRQFIPDLLERIKQKKDTLSAKTICNGIKSFPNSAVVPARCEADYNVQLIAVMRLGSCREFSLQAALAARRLGVPVALDFTPHWANRSFSHEWNALITPDNKPLAFGIGDKVELGKHIEIVNDRIAPKIYRETFAKQPTSLAVIHGKEDIPPTLFSPCFIDVTKDYYETIDVPIKLLSPPPAQNKFAYLSVFNNREWVPVAWSKIEGAHVTFRYLNKGIVCLPSYYQLEVIPAAYPVILHKDGKISTLKPNLQKRETVILNRKYQQNLVSYLGGSLVGGRFQVANDSTFKDAIDIYKINTKPGIYYQVVDLTPTDKYKYFRYVFAKNRVRRDLAEMEVYESGSKAKLSGRIIGSIGNDANHVYANIFDGLTTTKYSAPDGDSTWVGLAFDSPKSIRRITYLPANDDNCICNDELYELFYWDNKWVSLGKQTGSNETYRLTYNNVPTNALLLLRNLTKGREERIFTYEKGEQVWW